MGTNFYLRKKSQTEKIIEAVRDHDYFQARNLMDDEYIHIAKTSVGWLPIFQMQNEPRIKSVQDIKKVYEEGYNNEYFDIVDEYGNEYNWEQFEDRVLKFNGGTRKNRKLEKVEKRSMDPDMPDHIPVSHFEYAKGRYAKDFFIDPEGYEFDYTEFC